MNHKIAENPIVCPDCGDNIDVHWMDGIVSNGIRYTCLCGCRNLPSDIARTLLTAEPTEAEVRAASEALESELADVGLTWTAARHAARAALRAAREARA